MNDKRWYFIMFNVQSSMFKVQGSMFKVQSSRFNSIELFPLTPWRHSACQQGVGEGIVGELLSARVEEELGIQALGDDTEAEHLREHAVDFEGRARLLFSHAG